MDLFQPLLQGSVATVLVMMIGYTWFSEAFFMRPWWMHTFPRHKFGDTSITSNDTGFYLTLMSSAIQSAILTFLINTIRPLVPDLTGIMFPVVFSLVLAGIILCTSVPHYVYGRKSFTLLLICCSYDVIQVTASSFVIFGLECACNSF